MESNMEESGRSGASTPPAPDNEAFLPNVDGSSLQQADLHPTAEIFSNLRPTAESKMQNNVLEPSSSRSSAAPTLNNETLTDLLQEVEDSTSKQVGYHPSVSLWTPVSPDLDQDYNALLQDVEKSTLKLGEGPATPAAAGCPKQNQNLAKRFYLMWKSLSWKAEILSWFSGFCFFMATISVLFSFNHRLQPNLMFGITLNALVGLLGTFADVFFMAVVSSAFGQLKWLRALRKRPMIEFKAMDEASRGPWGSFLLLVGRTGGLVALLGAVVTIIALGSSTFFQQALSYETLYLTTSDAYMPIAQYMMGSGPSEIYIARESQDGPEASISISPQISDKVDVQLLPSPYFAFFSPPQTNFTINAYCGSNNCTWNYTTLGICNTCKDISHYLQSPVGYGYLGAEAFNWSLPNDLILSGRPDGSWSAAGLRGAVYQVLNVTTGITGDLQGKLWNTTNSIAFPNNGSELLRVFAIGSAPGKTPTHFVGNDTGFNHAFINDTFIKDTLSSLFAPPVAFECLLQACVQDRTATFLNGTLSDTIVSNYTSLTQSITPQENSSMAVRNITITPPNSGTTFVVSANSIVSFAMWLTDLLTGNVTLFPPGSGPLDFIPNNMNVVTSQPLLQAVYLAMNKSATGFPDLMDNLAGSLSANLRTTPYQPGRVAGTASSPMSHVIVTWEWLILPLVELVGSLMFLIAVIIESKKRKLEPWTTNILATFFHGFDERPLRQLEQEKEKESSMNQEARNLEMEFLPHEAGGGCLALVKPEVAVVSS